MNYGKNVLLRVLSSTGGTGNGLVYLNSKNSVVDFVRVQSMVHVLRHLI